MADTARAQSVPWSVGDAAVRGKETAGYHKRAVSDAAAPSGNEATAAGGGNKEPSEWQRSIKSRESASPKILSGTATGTESTGHPNRDLYHIATERSSVISHLRVSENISHLQRKYIAKRKHKSKEDAWASSFLSVDSKSIVW